MIPRDGATWIASFDIGKRNFAFCVEEVDLSVLSSIKKLPLSQRYNEDYTPSDQMKRDLNKVYLSGKIILLEKANLTGGNDKYYDAEYCHNMTEFLDRYISYWNRCSVFVIEQQMSFRGKINSMALKLGQHCFSYFAINYKRFKSIIEFPAYHKTNVLGAERSLVIGKNAKRKWKPLGDKERKKWAITKAKEILYKRGDTDHLELYEDKPRKRGVRKMKLDDISDTIVELQAFKYLVYVAEEL